jgi:hypothetical protein
VFAILTSIIAALLILSLVRAYWWYRDPFHPAIVLAPMLGFIYVFMPVRLAVDGRLENFLTPEQASLAQATNALGCAALLLGLHWGSRHRRRETAVAVTPVKWTRLLYGALALGLVGVAGYVFTLQEVGGFEKAFGEAYGGGTAESGYVRELYLLTVPAILCLEAARRHIKRPFVVGLAMAISALPLIVQGVLGARRGPSFMAFVAIAASYFLFARKRPKITSVGLVASGLGVLLLFLVSNRGAIYLGSDFHMSESPFAYTRAGEGNEFLVGAGTIVNAVERSDFTWGGRYATVLLIRPIPRSLWPTKYADASHLFGIHDMEVNWGIDPGSFQGTVGWVPGLGTPPGLVGDLFQEVAWWCVVPICLIGLAIGRVWARERIYGGWWSAMYGAFLALSLYLVMQTLEAMLFRLLIMAVPMWIVWWWSGWRRLGGVVRLGSPAGA